MARRKQPLSGTHIRFKEPLKRQLEQAAREHHTSLNGEIVSRLEISFGDTSRINDLEEQVRVLTQMFDVAYHALGVKEGAMDRFLDAMKKGGWK
jgi:hypothetical protein